MGADAIPTIINATSDHTQPFEINEEDPEIPIDEVKVSELKAKADTEPYWNFKLGTSLQEMQFGSNAIRTSKYTLASFIPLNFLYQITKTANMYFIGIICL